MRISYDPSRVSYEELLTAFWHSVDPTDPGGQFGDPGQSYQTAIFVHDEAQRRAAEASKAAAQEALGETIVAPIEDTGPFYPAEGYHQDHYEKNPLRYRFYRCNCGRDDRIEQVWGDRAFEGIPDHSWGIEAEVAQQPLVSPIGNGPQVGQPVFDRGAGEGEHEIGADCLRRPSGEAATG